MCCKRLAGNAGPKKSPKIRHLRTIALLSQAISSQLRYVSTIGNKKGQDRTARRQFQATGQPVSRTQASDAMTSWLPRYKAKCVQRRCFQCGSVPLRADIKGTELPPANWYHLKANWLHYSYATESFYIMKLCSRLFVVYYRNCPKDDKFRYFIPISRKLGVA